MTRHPIRSTALFVLALVVMGWGTFLLQGSFFTQSDALDLTPVAAPPTAGTSVVLSSTAAGAAPQSSAPMIDPDWVRRTAKRAGIPEPAMLAYARGTVQVRDGCGLGWTTLAAIGWVESQHGTIGGRTLGADGTSSTRILGPALDGVGDVAAIAATEATVSWHGDPDWDHAVGQLQFIPSTWEDWASDGDGDGVMDPNDIDDAALAAARYLCADGNDLTTGSGWAGAVYSYNHAQVYVDSVYAAATTYAERIS